MTTTPAAPTETAHDAPRPPLTGHGRQAPSFVFSSPGGTLTGTGIHVHVPDSAAGGAGAAAAETLAGAREAGHPAPVVVGALGFATDTPARLVVPAAVDRAAPEEGSWLAAPVDTTSGIGPDGAGPDVADPDAVDARTTGWDARPEPVPPGYAAAVHRALDRIAAGDFSKVVLARALDLVAPDTVDVAAVLARLAAQNPGSYAFAVDLAGPTWPDDAGPRPVLAGSSPELLLARRGDQVISNPLAGTVARSADPDEDARRAAALRGSAKDHREHALVVEQVAERLAPFCVSLDVPEPELTGTAALWHLSTRVTGRLRAPRPSSLELAEALHPTAAVCGEPTAAARAAIGELEEFDRSYYTGLVGWNDAHGDGEWAVTIRCAEIAGRRVRLYAGAGVVEGSRPEAELAETGAKFRTLLAAIGLEGA